jgi:hypothetical protein
VDVNEATEKTTRFFIFLENGQWTFQFTVIGDRPVLSRKTAVVPLIEPLLQRSISMRTRSTFDEGDALKMTVTGNPSTSDFDFISFGGQAASPPNEPFESQIKCTDWYDKPSSL